jgi:hypothetical protein
MDAGPGSLNKSLDDLFSRQEGIRRSDLRVLLHAALTREAAANLATVWLSS